MWKNKGIDSGKIQFLDVEYKKEKDANATKSDRLNKFDNIILLSNF